MIKTITRENLHEIPNESFRSYAERYLNIEDQTNEAIEGFGLPFNKEPGDITKEDVIGNGVISRNEKKSLYTNWISPACRACKKGDKSITFFISLKCHKNCYFCFNPNQEEYATFRVKNRNLLKELSERVQNGERYNHIALTGGEPLLHKKETVEFFKFVREKSRDAYTRLYTAGDLLTREVLEELKDAGLNEIRFSIKQEETEEQKEKLFAIMEMAKEYIPIVVVEMPVIPGTLEEMKQLLHRLEEIGIHGINLLEFCFPMHNAEEFQKRGFELKFPPYETYYNYWYAGALAVKNSEEECLKLLQYATEQKLRLGVHYCSLENKHTGQLYQQNKEIKLPKLYSFSNNDYFIKSAKVFGEDKEIVVERLRKHGWKHYEEDASYDFLQFPLSAIKYLRGIDADIAICSFVSEVREGENVLREVKVEWTKPK